MSNKDTRSGGKYSGNHTTLVPAAALVCDVANKCELVTRISPGFITGGLRSVSGKKRVKITKDGVQILLSIRDSASHQEVHVYATDIPGAIVAIARGCRDAGIAISFTKEN